MSENYINTIAEDKVYPIIRCKEADRAVEVAKALVQGGIRVLEINVENPSIYEAINEVSKYATVCAVVLLHQLRLIMLFKTEQNFLLHQFFK